MIVDWPPSEPFYEREPWPPLLPSRVAAGFVAIGIEGFGNPRAMAALWSDQALDDAHRYYQAARQCVWANWAIERAEDWSPSGERFSRWVEVMWMAGCRLVIAAHLAQQWVQLADPDAAEIPGLRRARNAIEHLHEADVDSDQMIATTMVGDDGKKRAWDIQRLPEGHLIFGMGKKPLETVFDAVSLEEIVAFAREHGNRRT